MATTKISTGVLKDGSVTSAKLDTNISIVGDLTVDTNTLFVDSASNRVGIGTSSPSTKFEVNQGADNNGITLSNSARGASRVEYQLAGTSNEAVQFKHNNGTDILTMLSLERSILGFYTSGTERMRINSNGNVGIGTSSPVNIAAYTTLDIRNNLSGGILYIGKSGTDSLRLIGEGTNAYIDNLTTTGNLLFRTNNATERMRIDSSGNVGIGQSSPNNETNRVSLELNDIWGGVFQNSVSGIPKSEWRWNTSGLTTFGSVANEPLVFIANNTERMRITGGGNVGIGTSSPTQKLQVNNGTDLNVAFNTTTVDSITTSRISSVNDAVTLGVGLVIQGTPLVFESNAAERMRIDSGGNVGINTTTPSTMLELSSNTATGVLSFARSSGNTTGAVGGALQWINSDDNTLSSIWAKGDGDNNGAHLIFTTTSAGSANDPFGNTERMRLTSNGDLHVDGDVIAYSTTISDQRLKDDVQTIDNALDKVSNLRGVSYTWNNGKRKGQKDLGLIAQEVEQVLPELVREKEMPMIDGGTYKTVDYEKIVGVLIEAVKELKAEVESLKSK